jgi:alcohol dehydrogenase (cytochrome c)
VEVRVNRLALAAVTTFVVSIVVLSGQTQRVVPSETPAVVPEKLKDFVPVTDDMLLRPKPENWISFRNGYRLWGYSALNQINAGNVRQLRLTWSRAMQPGPQEVEPLVYDGIMFLVNSEDIVQALDATTGDLLWEYRRKLPPDIGRLTGTNYRYRNLSIYQDKIFLATNDAFQIALEARSGRVLWESRRADYKDQVAQTTGPIVVKGKLLNGSRCNPSSPLPGGCFITAHEAEFGEPLWRVNVIARPGEPGGDTWGGLPLEARRHASAWMPGSYDAELNLVFWGTGVTAPVPETLRGAGKGDLLYTNSTLAIDPDTGRLVWYFQHLPRDNWDLDHPFERMIVETDVAPSPDEVPWISPRVRPGERRKVVTGIPGKTGIVWTLDARTGEFLWARPTIYQNIVTGIDVQTGRPLINEDSTPKSVQKPSFACPSALGGKNQPSGAYSPETGAMYMPMNNTCMDIAMSVEKEKAGPAAGYGMRTQFRHVPGADPATAPVGRLQAVSVSTGKTLWTYQQRAPIYGSLLATGGNLIFSGDVVRRFRAFHAGNGTMLWETILNGAVSGRPMTYSVNGRQYLAITAGGVTQSTGILDALTPELETPRTGNTLFVFALPD